MNRPFGDVLDAKIDQLQSGEHGDAAPANAYESLAQELMRVAAEESPRLSSAANARNLAALRGRAAEKRKHTAWGAFGAFVLAVPRWVQVVAVALLVVFAANGITSALANSLPGSPLYAIKQLTEGGELLLAQNNADRARLWMDLANRRLDEVQRLVGARQGVDQSALDAIDESLLRALTEIEGTRGTERVELLGAITQLAIRQQAILDALAANALPDDRARLKQTAQHVAGVASKARGATPTPIPSPVPSSTPSAANSPTRTATTAPTFTASLTPSATWTMTPLPTDTVTPKPPPMRAPELNATRAAADIPLPSPTVKASGQNGGTPQPPPTEADATPKPAKTETPEHEITETPEHEKTETPGREITETPEPEKTETPESEKTETPEPEHTETPDHG